MRPSLRELLFSALLLALNVGTVSVIFAVGDVLVEYGFIVWSVGFCIMLFCWGTLAMVILEAEMKD